MRREVRGWIILMDLGRLLIAGTPLASGARATPEPRELRTIGLYVCQGDKGQELTDE